MGLLNDVATKGLSLIGASTSAGVKSPVPRGGDFPGGMIVTEIVNGKSQESGAIHLIGRFAPKQPFEFGGEQRIVREEYPGSSEPTIQILGPKETDITIQCEFRTNKFRGDTSLRDAAEEYQQSLDAMRIRGNLVYIELGTWKRYGFIKETKFRLYTLQKIDADITFEIAGFNKPKGWRIVNESDRDSDGPNKQITAAARAALASASQFPEEMPLSASDILNNAIGEVASAINLVTGFVEGIVDDADKLVASANRAVGLIKNARATLSRAKRNIGAITTNALGLVGGFQNELQQFQALTQNPDLQRQKATATIKNSSHIADTIIALSGIAALLAQLQKKFQGYVTQVPFRRHSVRGGDTLQNVSIKYYQTADNWKAIYDHNKLASSELVVGSILEIPRL